MCVSRQEGDGRESKTDLEVNDRLKDWTYLQGLVEGYEGSLEGGEAHEVGEENGKLLSTGLDLPPALCQAEVVPIRFALDLTLNLVLSEDRQLHARHVVRVSVHADRGCQAALQHLLSEVSCSVLRLRQGKEGTRTLRKEERWVQAKR